MKDVQLPLYHDNTVLRTEDFTNLKDSMMENLLTLLRGLTGYDGAQLLHEYHGGKFTPYDKYNPLSTIVFDGFQPCDHLGNPVEDFFNIDDQKFIYLTPGIALFCSKGEGNELLTEYRNDFIVSSGVKYISFTTEDGADIGNCMILARPVKREDLPKNILTRDSLSGKSYVKEYPTVEIYDVEFKVIEETVLDEMGPAVVLKEGWAYFGVRMRGKLLLSSDEQVNLFTALRELRNASSSKNIEMSHDDVVSRRKDPNQRNLVRWDNEGKLQTYITSNYKSNFKNIDLVNRYFVDMVMQEERLRVNQIFAEQYDILPLGTILMYNGTNWQNDVTIPGWYMCDGQNGTPDLRERFIAGCSYSADRTIPNAPGNFGGDNSFRLKTDHLPSHAHSIPAHNHTGTIANGGAVNKSVATGANGGHDHTVSGGKHRHTIKYSSTTTTGKKTIASALYDTWDLSRMTEDGEGSHTHDCTTVPAHSHTVTIDIPSHSHSITIASGGSGNTGSIGGNAAVDLSKSVKGYAVIFIMKVR